MIGKPGGLQCKETTERRSGRKAREGVENRHWPETDQVGGLSERDKNPLEKKGGRGEGVKKTGDEMTRCAWPGGRAGKPPC